MTRLTLVPAFMATACVARRWRRLQAPRNCLPQPERHAKK
jgi:hypothetical protein